MSPNKKQILEGSNAIALTIKNIAPKVVSAYPITPQTHIVEDLAKFKADGLSNFNYVRAESEFAAASIVLGASATGVRVYSATSSQGLLLMTEVIHNIAGLRLPVVMTCANRSISAPINIWNDHGDVMSIRTAGWIQLFAANHQEAVEQHVLAYRLAEQLNIPVMVNVDGFVLTHSYEAVIIPDKKTIKKYLPDYKAPLGTYLDPKRAVTLGGFFGPKYYMETREKLHSDLNKSLTIIKKEYKNWKKVFKIKNTNKAKIDNAFVNYYGSLKAKTIIIALGSMVGTIRATLKNKPDLAVLQLKLYRPFPSDEVIKLVKKAKYVAILEKAIDFGQAGPLYSDLASASLSHNLKPYLKNYIVGLGGKDISQKMILDIIKDIPKKNNYLKFIS